MFYSEKKILNMGGNEEIVIRCISALHPKSIFLLDTTHVKYNILP